VIAGTGSGKSLIFQLLCFARPGGVVLVVTPVKALMYDQVIFCLLRTDASGANPQLRRNQSCRNDH
jgi:superfamily II DNA helicase RecQ